MTRSKPAAVLFNSGTPNADVSAITDYTATLGVSLIRVSCNPAVTSTLKIEETYTGATEVHILNDGTALTAGNTYVFDHPAICGAVYNVHFGSNQTTAINRLTVQEIEV